MTVARGRDGLALERTLLAWRRTALGVAVLSAVAVRFTAGRLGWLAVLLGLAGLALAAAAYGLTGARRRRPSVPASGRGQASLAVATGLLGLIALAYVLAG